MPIFIYMSSSAGKFQDHYEVLELDPKASLETIVQAYAAFSAKYHPDNLETADPVKYDAVILAHEVLTDTMLRREFDKIKGVDADKEVFQFSGLAFFDALGRESSLRVAMLCVLYDRRRTSPSKPTYSLRQLAAILDASVDEMALAIWYLKQRSFAISDDKSNLQITVDGMESLETDRPSPDVVMPFIKTSAISNVALAPLAEAVAARPRLGGRVMGLMKSPV